MPLWTPGLITPGAYSGSGGASPLTTAYLARTTALGQDYIDIYTTLLDGIYNQGYSASIDALYMWANQDETNAVLNMVQDAFNCTDVNDPLFTQNVGYNANSGTSCINSNFVPSTAGGNYTQNLATVGIHLAGGSDANVMGFGCLGSSNHLLFQPLSSSASTYTVNTSGVFDTSVANGGTAAGMWVAGRTGATATFLHRDSSGVTTDTDTSGGLPDQEIYFGGYNSSDSAAGLFGGTWAAGFIGGLSAANAQDLATRISTAVAAVGAL